MSDALIDSTDSAGGAFHIASAGHALLAASLIWLGALGLAKGTFVQIWQPAPSWIPAREAIAYLLAIISLASGLGLLWRRSAAVAARVILASFTLWIVLMRLPNLFYQRPLVLVAWSFGATAVMAAAAWVLFVRFAGDDDRRRLGRIADARGVRIAQALFGLSLIPFGFAHFMYVDATAPLIPQWLPFPVALAYLTGGTFIAAGLAMIVGVLGRLAAALTTWQIGLFTVVVWMPRVFAGTLSEFQRGEVVASFVLTAGAWVLTESYRATPSAA